MALLVAGAVIAGGLFAGCGPKKREKAMAIFFDRSGKKPPPTRRVRRDFLQEIAELERKLERAEADAAARAAAQDGEEDTALPAEQAATWEEAAALLSKDAMGQVDWDAALKAGEIAPRPGFNPESLEQSLFDLDVRLESSGGGLFSVTFSHEKHTRWLACGSCHPGPFSLRRNEPAAVVTMQKIENGEQCGTCHGSVSFGTQSCDRCHDAVPTAGWEPPPPALPIEAARTWEEAVKLLPSRSGTHDWAGALRSGVVAPRPGIAPDAEAADVLDYDVEFVPDDDPDLKAVFSHGTHTEWLSCENCHEEIFEAAEGANPMSMEKLGEGEYCGVCHGTVTFGVEEFETCARCHPGLEEE
jgi:c(7)-type cytochrome triheme protein